MDSYIIHDQFDPEELYGDLDDYDPFEVAKTGTIRFLVLTNTGRGPNRTFEIEILDYDGCANWAQEGMGLEYWICDHLDLDDLRVGGLYTVPNMNVTFYRDHDLGGFGYQIDEEWDFDDPIRHFHPGHRIAGLVVDFWHQVFVYRWRLFKESFHAKH